MRTLIFILASGLLLSFPAGTFSEEEHQAEPETAATGTLVAEETSLPADLLDRAYELLKRDRPESALEALRAYKAPREEKAAYHYAYARALVLIGKSYESIEHYRLAYIYAAQPADKERLLLERAQVYEALQYYNEAVVSYGIFIKQFPKSASIESAEKGLAKSYFQQRFYREALEHYEKAGSSLEVLYGKANALQALGKTKEAYEIYRELIDNDPEVTESPSETLFNIGENFRMSKQFADAKIYFSAVRDKNFKYRVAIGLGRIAREEKKYDEALGFFSTAMASPERQVRRDAILYRAEVNMALEKYDEAEAALKEIRQQFYDGKEYDACSLMLARLYRTRGKYKDASAVLKGLIIRRTPSVESLDELEALMLTIKDKDRAALIAIWNSTGRWLMDPSRSEAIASIAQGLKNSGRPLLDVCAWLIRHGTDKTKSQARLMMADFYASMGETTIAVGYIDRARVKGHSDEVLRVRANAYLSGGNAARAAEALMAIQKMQEGDMHLLLDTMQQLKNIDKVAAFCRRVFEKEALSIPARIRFADILFSANRHDDALAQYRAAIAMPKAATPDSAATNDLEWAQYRVAELSKGDARLAALKAIERSNNTVGHFAAAEYRSALLKKQQAR